MGACTMVCNDENDADRASASIHEIVPASCIMQHMTIQYRFVHVKLNKSLQM